MNKFFKPSIDERPIMIILGILILYFLICGFVFYLYLLHRITIIPTVVCVFIFTMVYLPRLFIIKKIINKDIIKIVDSGININNRFIQFSQIQDFRVEEKKPAVVFFMNNNMIVFNEARFYLKINPNTSSSEMEISQISFNAIGSEKIQLLKEFLSRILNK